jgi:hypothetical protein
MATQQNLSSHHFHLYFFPLAKTIKSFEQNQGFIQKWGGGHPECLREGCPPPMDALNFVKKT